MGQQRRRQAGGSETDGKAMVNLNEVTAGDQHLIREQSTGG